MTTQVTDASEAIATVNQTFMAAFARGDAAGVAALYTDGGQLLPPGSDMVTGKAGIEAFWQGMLAMGIIKRAELHRLELDQHGETAIEVGRATLYNAAGEVIDRPKYVVVWKCDAGQWKLHRDIWNSDTPMAP